MSQIFYFVVVQILVCWLLEIVLKSSCSHNRLSHDLCGPKNRPATLVNTPCIPLGSRACLKRGPEIRFPPQLNHYTFSIVYTYQTKLQVIKKVRRYQRRRRARLPASKLKKLKILIYSEVDEYDMCAICLDDFEDGDKLRILPCNHGEMEYATYK